GGGRGSAGGGGGRGRGGPSEVGAGSGPPRGASGRAATLATCEPIRSSSSARSSSLRVPAIAITGERATTVRRRVPPNNTPSSPIRAFGSTSIASSSAELPSTAAVPERITKKRSAASPARTITSPSPKRSTGGQPPLPTAAPAPHHPPHPP